MVCRFQLTESDELILRLGDQSEPLGQSMPDLLDFIGVRRPCLDLLGGILLYRNLSDRLFIKLRNLLGVVGLIPVYVEIMH